MQRVWGGIMRAMPTSLLSTATGRDTQQLCLSVPIKSRLKTILFPRKYVRLLLHLVDSCPTSLIPNRRSKVREDSFRNDLKELIEGNHSSSSTGQELGRLVYHSLSAGKTEHMEAMFYLINNRDQVKVTESDYSLLLSAMNNHGWDSAVKINFRRLVENGISCRVSTAFALIKSAIQRRDFKFAAEVMHEMILSVKEDDMKSNVDIATCMDKVVEGCVGAGQEGVELVEEVLEWYQRNFKAAISKDTISLLVKFVRSLGGNHQITETEIQPNGCCKACGQNLNATLPKSAHNSLLEKLGSIIVDLEKRHLYPSQYMIEHLKTYLQRNKFGAVLDGLNVAMFGQTYCLKNVIAVARKIAAKTGLPPLVILRWHSITEFRTYKWYSSTRENLAKIEKAYKPIRFFFVNHHVDDDLYILYATFASGENTFFISNDKLGDKKVLLSNHYLDRWRQSQQIKIEWGKTDISLVMPCRHNVQWTSGGPWHLPYDSAKNNWLCVQL